MHTLPWNDPAWPIDLWFGIAGLPLVDLSSSLTVNVITRLGSL
jgi:hypothetical protein